MEEPAHRARASARWPDRTDAATRRTGDHTAHGDNAPAWGVSPEIGSMPFETPERGAGVRITDVIEYLQIVACYNFPI